jgi:Tol biopolymer transport system component
MPPDTPTPAASRAVGPPPRLTGQILFPVFDLSRQTYDVYRLEVSTGQLGLFEAEASQPALSAGGTQVAYRSWRPDYRGLVVRSLHEGEPWRLTEFTEAARPRWSPEGERFLFFGRQEPDRKERIYLFTGAETMPVVEVRRDGSPILGTAPAWLPDGRMVYQGCYQDKCGLIRLHVDGTGSTVLVEDTTAVAPDVSPDGSQIAFMSRLGGYWQVNVVRADGSGWHRLTDDWYWNGLPVWSPDGRHIAFVSTRDENWPDTPVEAENRTFSLWVMDADGGGQRQLHPFTWVVDGVPGSVPGHEHSGWVEESIAWGP